MPQNYISNFLLFGATVLFLGKVWAGSAMGHPPLDTRSHSLINTISERYGKANKALIEGELKQYHKLTLTWDGPALSESQATFRNYRFNVVFTAPSGKTYKVPGYFAADGNAAETSAISGMKWRCHFLALESGLWRYEAAFRMGDDVALSTDENEGSPVEPIDGDAGSFTIAATDKSGKDFRSKGKLEYVGQHFMQWSDGEYFMKIGSNSPENLFEYGGFDDSNSSRTFPDHIDDWVVGDPTWKNGEGKGIIGAINYLSEKGINSQYFVLHRMEANATPWTAPSDDYFTYDVSKMDQWQVVFDHMMQKGVMAHIVFSESQIQSIFEVASPSEDPTFSDARKLYFREIVARFGYLNAVTWNIGEENGWDRRSASIGEEGRPLSTEQQERFAAYIDDLAYYNDFITIHNGPSHDVRIFDRLQGENSLTGISMQGFFGNVARSKGSTEKYRRASADAGKKWVVYYDEAFFFGGLDVNLFRKNVLWSTLTSGGAGIEHYATEGKDITLEDFRYYDTFFTQMRYAYDFYHDNSIPYHDMYNQDERVANGWCHGTLSDTYVIYITEEQLGNTTIDLTGAYSIKWFNPRKGGALTEGTLARVSEGDDVNIGVPSSTDNGDWVALLRLLDTENVAVDGITIVPDRVTIGVGEGSQLNVELSPASASNRQVVWASSDTAIVTVDSEGAILGQSEGNAVVTATSDDGGFMAQADVEVIDDSPIAVTGVSLLPETMELALNETQVLEATVLPSDATNTEVVWSSSNPDMVSVDANGKVNGISIGSAIITVTTVDGGFSATAEITVAGTSEIRVTGITLPEDEIDLELGQKVRLEAMIIPSNATNKTVFWSSEDPTIVAVDADGELLGVAAGSALITVSTQDGDFKAEVRVSVTLSEAIEVTAISVDPSTTDLEVGMALQLQLWVQPANAITPEVVWSSDNPFIASVDISGKVTGVDVGTTIIKVTSVDGMFSAQSSVTVVDTSDETDVIPVTGLLVDDNAFTLFEDDLIQIQVTVVPSNASNADVIWGSDNEEIATVDANGYVTAQGVGETAIYAKTLDGGFEQVITVKVLPNATIAFPNPASDFINIIGTDERITIFIFNSNGLLLRSAKGGDPIYVGDLSNSTYILFLSTGERLRFVKR